MTNDIGGAGGDTPPRAITEQTAHKIGEQILDILKPARLAPAARPAGAPADLGRLVHAFLRIEDPRIRSEFVALIEAVGAATGR